MNFLTLCTTTREESRIPGSGPTSTVSQSGEYLRIVNAIQRAYKWIQAFHPNWLFMWDNDYVNTVSGTADYAYTDFNGIASFMRWKKETGLIYESAEGVDDENEIPFIDFRTWQRIYGFGDQDNDRPVCFTVVPDTEALRFGPTPDDVYVFTIDYYLGIDELSGNTDTPLFDEFHEAIVYKAVMSLAHSRGNINILDYAEEQFNYWFGLLEEKYKPPVIIKRSPIGGQNVLTL